ncbi:MAG TPA: hypothetical protein VMY35_00480, partial [Phycisphaerae bacterium]|nr:hypothetical protein [Phycisphaerae bacterium]
PVRRSLGEGGRPIAQNFNGGGVKSARSMPRQVDMTRRFRTGLERHNTRRASPPAARFLDTAGRRL